jgi:hypothetical protein
MKHVLVLEAIVRVLGDADVDPEFPLPGELRAGGRTLPRRKPDVGLDHIALPGHECSCGSSAGRWSPATATLDAGGPHRVTVAGVNSEL